MSSLLRDPVRRWLHSAVQRTRGVGCAAVASSRAPFQQQQQQAAVPLLRSPLRWSSSHSAAAAASNVPVTRDAALARVAEIQGSVYPNFVGGADLRKAGDVREEYAHLEAREHNEVRYSRHTRCRGGGEVCVCGAPKCSRGRWAHSITSSRWEKNANSSVPSCLFSFPPLPPLTLLPE